MDSSSFLLLPETKERLHPSLRRCLHQSILGKVLQHPLVVQSYTERYNAIYNRQFLDKSEAVSKAQASRNWTKYIWLHERPFRAKAFRKIAADMSDDQYWRMLANVWVDAENIFQMRSLWERIWTSKRPRREQVMTDDEHDALAILPEVTPGLVTIYRGCRDQEAVEGMSWAVSRTTALWFAYRYANPEHKPLLVTATVNKRDIQAYFIDRRGDEAEIVVLPQDVLSRTVESV